MWLIIFERTKEEIAKNVAKSSAFSALADGAFSIADKESVKETTINIVGGAITGASSALAKEGAEYFFKNTKIGLAAGLSAGIITRHTWKRLTKEEKDEQDSDPEAKG